MNEEWRIKLNFEIGFPNGVNPLLANFYFALVVKRPSFRPLRALPAHWQTACRWIGAWFRRRTDTRRRPVRSVRRECDRFPFPSVFLAVFARWAVLDVRAQSAKTERQLFQFHWSRNSNAKLNFLLLLVQPHVVLSVHWHSTTPLWLNNLKAKKKILKFYWEYQTIFSVDFNIVFSVSFTSMKHVLTTENVKLSSQRRITTQFASIALLAQKTIKKIVWKVKNHDFSLVFWYKSNEQSNRNTF